MCEDWFSDLAINPLYEQNEFLETMLMSMGPQLETKLHQLQRVIIKKKTLTMKKPMTNLSQGGMKLKMRGPQYKKG